MLSVDERLEELRKKLSDSANNAEQYNILSLKLQGAIEILEAIKEESEDKPEQKKKEEK